MMYNEKNKEIAFCILAEEFEKRKIDCSDFDLNKIVSDLLDIINSTGGAFSKSIIRDYSISYIDNKIYDRF
ncbi:MAG: hypothetical protein KAZ87_01395 [Spirochaetes bacterium]|nr:hypothetical protein [Spirochaetota bacterium]